MDKIAALIIIIVSAFMLTLVSHKMFLIFQLSSYRARGVWNWFKITKIDYIVRYFALAFLSFIAMFVYVACFYRYVYVRYLGMLAFIGLCILFIVLTRREKSKVPLKFTARMVRFNIVTFILYAALALGVMFAAKYVKASYSLIGILAFFVPFVVTLAHFIVLPFETLNNYSYKVRAKGKLETMQEMIRIGITGSYGKTTTKTILAKMLENKYRVCYGKASYNTPMGICKVVNNDLPDDTQIFVAEMGARFVGDIKELAEMVRPNYGIITAIGNQHLETFGSLENIANTKYELVENLCPGGKALFNGDSEPNVALFEKTQGEKLLTGKEGTVGAEVFYKDVIQGADGVEFTLHIGGRDYPVKTQMLGGYIPSLMTLCAALAYELGVTAEEIVSTCEKTEPVPHRLELIKSGDMVIIDDAYNANVEGAESALAALAGFDGRVKVIITPGLVELGKEEKQANTDLGEKIGKVCDVAIFVGERGKQLAEGAMKAGMSEDKVKQVATLGEAVEFLRGVEGKTAVLFENDLPDNY